MISFQSYTIYQWITYAWFCTGVGIVGFFSFRDLIRLLVSAIKGKKKSKK